MNETQNARHFDQLLCVLKLKYCSVRIHPFPGIYNWCHLLAFGDNCSLRLGGSMCLDVKWWRLEQTIVSHLIYPILSYMVLCIGKKLAFDTWINMLVFVDVAVPNARVCVHTHLWYGVSVTQMLTNGWRRNRWQIADTKNLGPNTGPQCLSDCVATRI